MAVQTADVDQPDVTEKIPVRNWWHMLLYAWDLVEFGDRFATEIEDAPDLRALLTAILVYLTKHQIRRGLRGDYVERSEELRGVRGRIDFGRTLREMSIYRGRLHCDYEEFTLNVPRNQIIRSTLNDSLNRGFTSVESKRTRHGQLVSDIEALLRMLYEIDRVKVTRRLIASELRQLGRNEREYKLMLKICEMLQDPSMPQSEGASDKEYVDWLRKKEDENRIFELFVGNFYKLRLDRGVWRVSTQHQQSWNEFVDDREGNIRLPVMRPDIRFEHRETGKVTILDTKWYGSPVESARDDAVHTSNLYQMYAYLASQDKKPGADPTSTGILLYGQTKIGQRRLRTKVDEHPFWVETLDLMQDWQRVEDDLITLATETVA